MKYESEDKLLTALKSLARSDNDKCPPPSVEKSLQEYFQSMQTTKAAELEPLCCEPRWQRYWNILGARPVVSFGVCAAASILIVVGIFSTHNNREVDLPSAPIFITASLPTVVVEQAERIIEREAGSKSINRKFKAARSTPYEVMTVYVNAPEITTNFIYTGIEDSSIPMERGRLVRTLVPRQMLASYGLPVDPEKMNIPVKADLLVNEDGSTRAVRFIR